MQFWNVINKSHFVVDVHVKKPLISETDLKTMPLSTAINIPSYYLTGFPVEMSAQ